MVDGVWSTVVGIQIRKLEPVDAAGIVDCFRRVYGEHYANELFYDAQSLGQALDDGWLGSVGAIADDGTVLGHMAMTVHPGAAVVELGNTVVDPQARGEGLAWKVGAELSAWCRELGYQGFLHYPTTDHHIMQRQSVKAGFEVGLMLGYIPARTGGRQAATIVYEPYTAGATSEAYLPAEYTELLTRLAASTGLLRSWRASEGGPGGPAAPGAPGAPDEASVLEVTVFSKRGLDRCVVTRVGTDIEPALEEFSRRSSPCLQVDFRLDDPAVDVGVRAARGNGFVFCGWLPGYRGADVLRLQRLDPALTDLSPALENPQAVQILELIRAEAGFR